LFYSYFSKALFVTIALVGLMASPVLASQLVNITADKQSFDPDGRTKFSGNVKVDYNNVNITSKWATLDINSAGMPDIATFYEKPLAVRTVPSGQDDLKGNVIKIYINDNKIRAEGDTESLLRTVAENLAVVKADIQEFENKTKIVHALGNVFVDYDTTKIYSPEAKLWMNDSGKAKRAVFTGGSRAEKEKSQILSERLTIISPSGNLLAENNVKTNIQSKPKQASDPDQVLIDSDFQQYDKASDTMIASGNVRIDYGDYKASGPKATFKLQDGQVEKIILTGRAKIITATRQVLADQIVITTNPKNFDATGNVKSKFVTNSGQEDSDSPSKVTAKPATGPAIKGKAGAPAHNNTSQQSPTDEYLE